MKLIQTALLVAGMTLVPAGAEAQLVINELMQSNIDCIMDDLNDFPDSWVELYNSGTSAVNLGDYSICDANDASKAWKLPARNVAPKGRMLIYCDKVGDGLHTDFRLESGKGACVYLFKGNTVADQVEGLKKQPAPNIAYGRETDGADKWGYMYGATPGASNCGKIVKDILGEPVFSEAGRVSSTSFTLNVTLPAGSPADAKIHYTTDGSEPTAGSAVFPAAGLNINKTTTIRAVVKCDGYMSPRSTAQSYIFFPRAMTFPVISMLGNDKYFNDAKIGIYAGENYWNDWRRPVNFELFMEPGKESVINQLCETRIKGGATRGAALKSMAIYANKRFGVKRLTYEFFPEDAPGLDDWKSIEIRNSGNDFDYLYFRDALIQRVMGRHVDMDWQPWQPAIFMLNGEYRGILNIRPRSNEDYIYTYYDGLEDIDMFENWWELKTGTWDNYNAFKDFYGGTGQTLAEFDKWMDTGEFANLMIMNLFFDNKDFPANNIVMWRPRTENGRWRWIAKDTDFGLGLYGHSYNYNTVAWVNNNDYDKDYQWGNSWDGTRLFRRLMANEDFKNIFVDRCAVYIGDFMNATVTKQYLDEMNSIIKDEYPHHRKLFNEWWPNRTDEITFIKNWIDKRTPLFLNFINSYYKTGTPTPLTIDKGRLDNVKLTVNDIDMSNRTFDGRYYAGRTLRISGKVADETKAIAGWKVTVTLGSSSTTTEYTGSTLEVTMPSASNVAIQSVMGESSLDTIENENNGFDFASSFKAYDLQGRQLGEYPSLDETSFSPGVYILRQGTVTLKYMVE